MGMERKYPHLPPILQTENVELCAWFAIMNYKPSPFWYYNSMVYQQKLKWILEAEIFVNKLSQALKGKEVFH